MPPRNVRRSSPPSYRGNEKSLPEAGLEPGPTNERRECRTAGALRNVFCDEVPTGQVTLRPDPGELITLAHHRQPPPGSDRNRSSLAASPSVAGAS